MKRFHSFVNGFPDSHLLIACAAAAFTWSGFIQLQARMNPAVIALTGFATLLTYNSQNLLRRFAPHRMTEMLPWFFHLFFALAGLSGVIVCLVLSPPKLVLWLLLPGALSVLYATPVFPYRGLRVALRGYPYIKIWLILIVWVWVTAVIPVLFSDTRNSVDITLFIIQRGLLVFSLLVPFDIRDLETDYSFQRTIPQMTGTGKAAGLALAAAAGYVAVVLLRYSNGMLEAPVATALIVTGLYACFWITGSRKPRPTYYYTVFVDSVLLIQPLLIRLFMAVV